MNNKRSLYTLLFVSILVSTLSRSAVHTKEGDKEDAIAAVLSHNDFQAYLFSAERYMPPEKLTNKNPAFRALSEQEKERIHFSWFKKETEKQLQKVIRKEIIRRSLILTAAVASFLYLFAKPYLMVANFIIKIIKNLLGKKPGVTNKEAEDVQGLLELLRGFFYGVLNRGASNKITLNDKAVNEAGRVSKMLAIMSFHYAFIYFKYPTQWFLWEIKAIWKLYWFSQQLDYKDALTRVESLFMKTYNILTPQERKRLIKLLLRARAGYITNINQLVKLFRVYRAQPRGYKEAVFDRKIIDEALVDYSPEIQAFARQICAMLVMYTKALKAGKGHIFARLPIQPFLLLGAGGIGKSRLLAKILEATGLRPVSLNLTDRQLTALRGTKKGQPGSGVLSIYADALIDSADERGRNYANSPLIIEEIDKALNYPSAIHYYLDLLDPRTRYIKDDYLGVKVPKLIFIFATSNYNIPEVAIIDRFRIIRMNGITKENKKNILHKTLLPAWIETLNEPVLQGAYDESLSIDAATQEIAQELQDGIKEDNQGSVRSLEQKMFEKIATIMAESLEKKNNKKQRTEPPVNPKKGDNFATKNTN